MKRPPKRSDVPARHNDNDKRRLAKTIDPDEIDRLLEKASYNGSSKHKRNPSIFGLPPFIGPRGDATLCDEHAGFSRADIASIPVLLRRGLRAGLVGTNIWSVGDSGWIFECRITNAEQDEYHGYPVRPSEAIAEPVYMRFRDWAEKHGEREDKLAAKTCADLYGF